MSKEGYNKLWCWFSCSRASWLTLPRSVMHEMPDEWQGKMADLLEEWDSKVSSPDLPNPYVQARENGKICKWPEWLLNYRHPDKESIRKLLN